jgi:hypothetical protein
MIRFCSVLVLLVLTGLCAADGYIYRNGYYYNGAQAYTRITRQYQGYWSYGVYYPGAYYYDYVPYYAPAAPVVQENWRAGLLKIAGDKVKAESLAAKEQLEQRNYLEAINALGLQNTLRAGPSPGYVTNGSYYSSQYTGFNASTVYGGYKSAASLYDQDKEMQLYQMANQHTLNAQTLADKGQAGFANLVGQNAKIRADVAQIIAKKEMVVAMLKALEGPPSALHQGYSFQISPQGLTTDASKVDASTKEQLFKQFEALATAKCLGCHSSETKKGGFDVTQYPVMSAQQKQEVWKRLTTDDPDKLMPRTDRNLPGPKLTPEELRLFALN